MAAAIQRLKKLSHDRPDASFWDVNIIEAHSLCQNDIDHKHFWCYLTNPEEYDPMIVDQIRTIGDRINAMDIDQAVIQPLPDYMEEVVHKNGHHYSIEIRHKRRRFSSEESDDEKL